MLIQKISASIITSFFFIPFYANGEELSHVLEEIVIETRTKETKPVKEQPVASSSFNRLEIEQSGIKSPKDLSANIPNFHIPDYGSSITSSIYMRGLGARIDQPVLGLTIDNIPILNKNNYDFDFFDIQRIEVLRGPQSTLYGRNTMGGVINIYTLSPFEYKGVKANIDYSTANTIKAKASVYQRINNKFGYSISANYHHTDGYFTNEFKNEKCDKSDGGNLRVRLIWKVNSSLSISNTLQGGLLNEGGYAYALFDKETNIQAPVLYNDECGYKRKNITEGVTVSYRKEDFIISSTTSYQYLDDEMKLDQDFQPKSIFTLKQAQKEHTATEDLIIKSIPRNQFWQWKFGLWGFLKNNDMNSPVTFKKDGINDLILTNANNGIQTIFPGEELKIEEDEFIIGSKFKLPTYGTAIYHQSEFKLGNWNISAGLRFDYEKTKMEYHNSADIHYLFTLLLDDYKLLESRCFGNEGKTFYEILPKLSLQYNFNKNNNIYAYIAKGYKAGGFNTQIFSDILQNKIMNDMMAEMGLKFSNMGEASYDIAKATSYDPEYSWNYEIGSHLNFLNDDLTADIAMFYIDCKDQQLTVFPTGKSTGRMMTNAGKSRSFGAEIALFYRIKNVTLNGSYGYTNAKFVDYNDGNNCYDGKYVPYSPTNTANASIQYAIPIDRKILEKIIISADWKGVGKIYWNESNDVEQDFYSLIGGSLSFQREHFDLKFWCKNALDADYNTFYFVSMSNSFFQMGKPRQIGISLSYEF